MTTTVHRIHVPCPACKECTHLTTGGESEKDAKEKIENGEHEEVQIFQAPLADLAAIHEYSFKCEHCDAELQLALDVTIAIIHNKTADEQEAFTKKTTGHLH